MPGAGGSSFAGNGLRSDCHGESSPEISDVDNPMHPFSQTIEQQEYHIVDEFKLESGICLKDVTVAYKTWGSLNKSRDNVMVICHAFTGSANVEDWYVRHRNWRQ
jgi:homoserine acetyltransferase